MKDYKKEIDYFDYSKKPYGIPNEHAWDSLVDKKEVKKFENKEHKKQEYEIGEGVFVKASELLKPTKGDIAQSSPEVTGQFNAKPFPNK